MTEMSQNFKNVIKKPKGVVKNAHYSNIIAIIQPKTFKIDIFD